MTRDEFLSMHPEGSVKGIVDSQRVLLTGADFDAWVDNSWSEEITVPYPDDGWSYAWDENLLNWTPVTFGD